MSPNPAVNSDAPRRACGPSFVAPVNASGLEEFTDVRELQRQLKERGVELVAEADEQTRGPASFIAIDPDGNPVRVDQHV